MSPYDLCAELGPWAQAPHSLLRIAGRELPAGQQLARWSRQSIRAEDMEDPGLILPWLRLRQPERPEDVAAPDSRSSFAQLNEEQRWIYLDWLTRRDRLPGAGYAYLYLYGLEAGLFDRSAAACCIEIQWLLPQCEEPAFQAHAAFDLALGAWLTKSAELFGWAAERAAWNGPHASALLGMQAALGLDVAAWQLLKLSPTCGYTPRSDNGELLDNYVQIGLKAFEDNAGAPLLQHFADQLAGHEQPVDIRLANPAARFSLPLVDLLAYPPFRQAVSELLSLADREARAAQAVTPKAGQARPASGSWSGREWYVVLEFGESSSEQFERAVALAQKHPGYTRLLDEKRSLVHRVIFRRRDLRLFWNLLAVVRQWKSTHVYVNGEEKDPAQLWPHTLE